MASLFEKVAALQASVDKLAAAPGGVDLSAVAKTTDVAAVGTAVAALAAAVGQDTPAPPATIDASTQG